jgi:DNA-binding CsgD family transcriptional regulator
MAAMSRRLIRSILLWGALAAVGLGCLWVVSLVPLWFDYGRELWGAAIALLAVSIGMRLADRRRILPLAGPRDVAASASTPADRGDDPAPPRPVDAGADLSPREREILDLLAQGLSNKELARSLSVSENTVKTHLANLYAKLGVGRRTQALAVAQRLGVLRAPPPHPEITRPGDGRS